MTEIEYFAWFLLKTNRLAKESKAEKRRCDSKMRPNRDSDDEYIYEIEMEESVPNYLYPFDRLRRLYSMFARNEIHEILRRGRLMELEEIFELITLPYIARVSCLHYINLPFNRLKVTIGFQKVTILIGNTRTNKEAVATYERKFNGCTVRYPNCFITIRGTKYQSRAAKDFFTLLQNQNLTLEKLEYDIEPYNKENGQKWPFTAFLWKVRNYLSTLNHQLNVKQFEMKFFERQKQKKSRTHNQGMVRALLEFMKPGVLEYIGLSIWRNEDSDYIVNLHKLGGLDQWIQCKRLNIYDDHIRIFHPEWIENFIYVEMILPDEDVMELIETLGNYCPHEPWFTTIIVQPDFNFDLACELFESAILEGDIPEYIEADHDITQENRHRFHMWHNFESLFKP